MLLQRNGAGTDSLFMNMTPQNRLTESSDQELVDSYTTHAPTDLATEMTAKQIRRAAEAAHALELRGCTERAGVWLHEDRPSLKATA
jgi:hypothetical protein